MSKISAMEVKKTFFTLIGYLAAQPPPHGSQNFGSDIDWTPSQVQKLKEQGYNVNEIDLTVSTLSSFF